jgi:hypothetical protein
VPAGHSSLGCASAVGAETDTTAASARASAKTNPANAAGRPPLPKRSTLLSYTFLPFGPASCYPIRRRYFDHPGAALPKRATFIRVELVVSDDHGGLKAAIARHFQGASWQRCQVPYARNLLGMVGYTKRKELAEGLRGVFAAPSREVALRLASELVARWRRNHPRVAEHLGEHIEECLTRLGPSPTLTVGASAPPTGSRGSTRR